VEGIVYRDSSEERRSCGTIDAYNETLEEAAQTYYLYCERRCEKLDFFSDQTYLT
jgi:hypothetical protein